MGGGFEQHAQLVMMFQQDGVRGIGADGVIPVCAQAAHGIGAKDPIADDDVFS